MGRRGNEAGFLPHMPWVETTQPSKSMVKQNPSSFFSLELDSENLVAFTPNTIILSYDIWFPVLLGWDLLRDDQAF